MITEAAATALFCAAIGGIEEVRYNYYEDLQPTEQHLPAPKPKKHGYIRVDCETDEYVIEAGLDKRSSLDSVQQAVFFSVLTDKKPMVVIYNTDNKEGKYEYRIRKTAEHLGIDYRNISIISFSRNDEM